MLRTGLVVRLDRAAPAVAAAHAELHPGAVVRGIPLHVTLLFPFAPRDALDDAHLARVRSVLAAWRPFAFELARVAEFPGVVYAEPDPGEELRGLALALAAEFPEFPPYGGLHPDPVPHATLAVCEDLAAQPALAAAVRRRVEPHLPVRCEVSSVALVEEHAPERWRERLALPLAP